MSSVSETSHFHSVLSKYHRHKKDRERQKELAKLRSEFRQKKLALGYTFERELDEYARPEKGINSLCVKKYFSRNMFSTSKLYPDVHVFHLVHRRYCWLAGIISEGNGKEARRREGNIVKYVAGLSCIFPTN